MKTDCILLSKAVGLGQLPDVPDRRDDTELVQKLRMILGGTSLPAAG